MRASPCSDCTPLFGAAADPDQRGRLIRVAFPIEVITMTRSVETRTRRVTDAGKRGGHLGDEELMALAKRGDAEAFALIYSRHASLALALARRLVGDRALAEDITQDAFLTVWRNCSHYRAERGSARSWLLGILRHRAIDVQRRAGARERGQARIAGFEQREPVAELTEAEVERRDEARLVREALADLPAGQRQVIVLAYAGGLTQPEIADKLDVPLGTVKGRIRLGLERLRRDGDVDALGTDGSA